MVNIHNTNMKTYIITMLFRCIQALCGMCLHRHRLWSIHLYLLRIMVSKGPVSIWSIFNKPADAYRYFILLTASIHNGKVKLYYRILTWHFWIYTDDMKYWTELYTKITFSHFTGISTNYYNYEWRLKIPDKQQKRGR